MKALFDAISQLVSELSVERLSAIAVSLKSMQADQAGLFRESIGVTGNRSRKALNDLTSAWSENPIPAEQLAGMLLAAGHAYRACELRQSVELVWTGPRTDSVPTRLTEQVLIQVIEAAKERLFITSYVAYDVESVIAALLAAMGRKVMVEFLLELPSIHGGKVSIDAIANLRSILPDAKFYVWKEKAESFKNGSVHAKVAVADGQICFITSANLTGFAMERNMEAGVLIKDGHVPDKLHRHLDALVSTGVVTRV
ncbi:DISARM system phospholipase D-like protein DrmC [Pseudomonas sp. BMS12]|uniref:DISARM system phospholipase D-like protein DrmC n=1 Tax=Pseudomonas sp. BMS12 TaxID=1796033 RepID=UPI00083AC376|nr:DISARM system phospholipase D-like protein DrmC [Pseudomonas sp. BMS12]